MLSALRIIVIVYFSHMLSVNYVNLKLESMRKHIVNSHSVNSVVTESLEKAGLRLSDDIKTFNTFFSNLKTAAGAQSVETKKPCTGGGTSEYSLMIAPVLLGIHWKATTSFFEGPFSNFQLTEEFVNEHLEGLTSCDAGLRGYAPESSGEECIFNTFDSW